MKNNSLKVLVCSIIAVLLVNIVPAFEIEAKNKLSHEGYSLKQVVVLSRHNIRAPLSTKGSILEQVTPHTWFNWTSNASELSLRGGILETEMGQYFRKWLESEGLIAENYHPLENEVRFYANSKQRTIATAKYFSVGFIPTDNVEVETHTEFDKMDPVFHPNLNFSGSQYAQDALEQIEELFGETIGNLNDNYELLADVIDMDQSEEYKDYSFDDENTFCFNPGEEPSVTGALKMGTLISDALVFQYYEESDEKKAAFGNDLSQEQWQEISEIKDVYGDVLFTTPLVSTNVANPLIKELYSEMTAKGRKFSFLCGHDSNIGSVLAALGVRDYSLKDAIESKTPIGCKLVFSKWENEKGRLFWSVDLVYQSVSELREQTILDLETSPCSYHLSFNGIKQNKDGLYRAKDIRKLFKNSMDEYDVLLKKYTDSVAFLGPEGTYTQEACEKYFGSEAIQVPYKTVDEAVKALVNGESEYAVIPQENTIGGAVTDYVDTLILNEEVSVAGEVELLINQNLLTCPGTELKDIKTVYSHKQGIAQGAEWLKQNLPYAEIIEVSSTAEGARMVAEAKDDTLAAIASMGSAKVYGLEILAEGIQNNEDNKTRFYVLSKNKPSRAYGNRMAFIAEGKAEELPGLISRMKKNGMTLVSIHDRPLKTKLGEYYYIIECSSSGYSSYKKIIKNSSFKFRFLGCFDSIG